MSGLESIDRALAAVSASAGVVSAGNNIKNSLASEGSELHVAQVSFSLREHCQWRSASYDDIARHVHVQGDVVVQLHGSAR